MPHAASDAEQEGLLRRHYPAVRLGPKARGDEGTFEIAIVLAGAVSAGSYTAGVVDFLTEALDEWSRCKTEDVRLGRKGTEQTVPHHNVVLSVITGASAGGMNGAIAASAFGFAFPHANAAKAGTTASFPDNPFYSAWVDAIDIEPMLDTADLSRNLPPSLLNCAKLDEIAKRILTFGGTPKERDWLADPFELRLTNTNLRGVPFAFDLKSGEATHQGFRMHGDQVAFSVARTQQGRAQRRPDCISLGYDGPRDPAVWQPLADAALATGAFPIALQSRNIEVGGNVYDWRFSYFDNEANPGTPIFVEPLWPETGAPKAYSYAAVDGGVMNNEPFEMARTALAGPRGRNAQNGLHADRAVIVIDPFIEDPSAGPSRDAGMLDVAAKLIPAQINQARLSAQDFVQIRREDVYSRFMIAPRRGKFSGKQALATGELDAFGGFFCRAFRHHDFLLGRRNAQRFLQTTFTLPEDNRIFCNGRWSDRNRTQFADPSEPLTQNGRMRHLQIIPLCNHLNAALDKSNEQPAANWPRGAYVARRGRIEALIGARIDRLSQIARRTLAKDLAGDSENSTRWERVKSRAIKWAAGAYLGAGWWAVRGAFRKRILRVIDEAMARVDRA